MSILELFRNYIERSNRIKRDKDVEDQDICLNKAESILLRIRNDHDWFIYFLLNGSYITFPEGYKELFNGFSNFIDNEGKVLPEPTKELELMIMILTKLFGHPSEISENDAIKYVSIILKVGTIDLRNYLMSEHLIHLDALLYTSVNLVQDL